jgi:8-oxo-dGTP diphosphatase
MNLDAAKRILASGCLIRDDLGRILLVKPTYKPGWEIPGGMVEANESPAQACIREVCEELGLEIKLGRLLCLEYVALEPERLLFVFDAGVISDLEVEKIVLPRDELSEFRFVTLEQARELLPQRLARRVEHSLEVLEHRSEYVYLEFLSD